MSKVTKNQRIETLERKVAGLTTMLTMLQVWSDHADNMLTELNHALPDPEYDAKCEAQEADIDASLDRHRERLGLNKPQLKQLDQSVFNNMHERWKFAAVDADGCAHRFNKEVSPYKDSFIYEGEDHDELKYSLIGTGYDASSWQNSLIERDDIAKKLAEVDLSSELTGSELCKAMLERGDKIVTCAVKNHEDDLNSYDAIIAVSSNGRYYESTSNLWSFAVPINNQGEPLTASEVGL